MVVLAVDLEDLGEEQEEAGALIAAEEVLIEDDSSVHPQTLVAGIRVCSC